MANDQPRNNALCLLRLSLVRFTSGISALCVCEQTFFCSLPIISLPQISSFAACVLQNLQLHAQGWGGQMHHLSACRIALAARVRSLRYTLYGECKRGKRAKKSARSRHLIFKTLHCFTLRIRSLATPVRRCSFSLQLFNEQGLESSALALLARYSNTATCAALNL